MHKILLQDLLPGAANADARAIYRSLEIHFSTNACEQCQCYRKYSVILLNGDPLDHIEDLFAGYSKSARRVDVLLDVLQRARLIELEQVTQRQHRLTFLHLPPQEELGRIAEESRV